MTTDYNNEDIPTSDDQGPLPIRYVKGCDLDLVETRRRWDLTVQWREEEKIDDMLSVPHQHFDLIKSCYPHFVHKQAKNGCFVYYERIGGVNMAPLKEAGLTLDDLVHHYVYITEYIWRVIDKKHEGKLVTILDISGVGMKDVGGEPLEFVRKASKVIQAHYVERSFKIIIINSPWWFNMIWKLITPLMHENTKKKVSVAGGNYIENLLELIDSENIPEEYGGHDTLRLGESEQEISLRQHVESVNNGGRGQLDNLGPPQGYMPDEMPDDTNNDEEKKEG